MDKQEKLFYGLDLQFFADGGEDKGDEPGDKPADKQEDLDNEGGESGEKKFTQEDLNELAAKVRREEKEKRERLAEEERERLRKEELEQNNEYKTLLEEAQQTIAQYEQKEKALEREKSINEKLVAKGLTAEQIQRYSKYIHGESDEEIDASIESVYEDFVVIQENLNGDPSAGFGDSRKPEPKDDEDYGRELFKSIRK